MSIDANVGEIAQQVARALGDTLVLSTRRWITQPPGDGAVRDATLALYIDGKQGADDVVLLISNPAFPGAVGDDVAQAREIAEQASPDIARHIIAPAATGRFEGQRWAAFARLSPVSTNRAVRVMQKARAAQRILPWLVGLAQDTRDLRAAPSAYEAHFIAPLTTLAEDPDLSDALRHMAQTCRAKVEAQRPALFTVAQHGDFWIGNIMFARRRWPDHNPALGDFRVIDWRGARTDGYPGTDAIRFFSSLYRPNSPKPHTYLRQYQTQLEISDWDMMLYGMLGLGQLGQALDQFPKENYRLLCEETFSFLKAYLGALPGAD